ncbi:MAG: glycosyltransferase family 4 protein [Candidatus Sulfotelmatobacter sp.]|jgi:glycosyltransferase involved in cell wall biosynthesis
MNKKVLFTCNPHWLGGPTTWLRRASEYLPKHGWACKLVLPGTHKQGGDDWSHWPSPMEVLKPAYSGPALVGALSRTIGKFDADVVLNVALDATPNAIRMLRLRRRHLQLPYIDCLHNDNAFECERLRNHVDVISAVAVPSEGCAERVRTQIPELSDRVARFWCPAPCDASVSRDTSGGPLKLVYLGRLFQHGKRILDLVPLCAELVKRKVDFELTVIGDGPERNALEVGVRSVPGLSPRVRIMGWMANDKALQLLKQQHVLIMLSDLEGQPIALLEAMGSSVVPVVTDIPALREVIEHGENGFLLPVGDSQEFTNTLASLAHDRERLAEVAQAACTHIRGAWETGVAISKLSDLLHAVVSRPDRRGATLSPISYPPSRMTQLHVPHAVQGIKRRLLRQDIVF